MSDETAKKPARKTAAKSGVSRKTAKAVGDANVPSVRGTKKVREGVVTSNAMTKTVVVSIDRRMQHALYAKTVTRSRKLKAHDEMGCDVGDKVLVMETRPLSREKRWRVVKILEKVK